MMHLLLFEESSNISNIVQKHIQGNSQLVKTRSENDNKRANGLYETEHSSPAFIAEHESYLPKSKSLVTNGDNDTIRKTNPDENAIENFLTFGRKTDSNKTGNSAINHKSELKQTKTQEEENLVELSQTDNTEDSHSTGSSVVQNQGKIIPEKKSVFSKYNQRNSSKLSSIDNFVGNSSINDSSSQF